LIKERDPEEVSHEEEYQEGHEFPCEYAEEEHFDGTHLFKDLIHEDVFFQSKISQLY
jgi:hypothetical protein